MNKFRKVFVFLLASAMVALSVYALEADKIKEEKTQTIGFYNTYTGIVKEVADYLSIDNAKFVRLENKEGAEADFIITQDTYIVNNAVIEVGAELIGFYEAGRPMIMIYPPQISVDIVAAVSNDEFMAADKFDEELLSADKMLKLNLSDETEIINTDGSKYEGEIAGQKLIVFYTFMTKSIPAQTTPTKIIVLTDNNLDFDVYQDVTGFSIVVSGETTSAPTAYNNEDGVVMVPVRAIAEGLGYEVSWNNENQSVMIGGNISLTIGEDNYNINGNIVKLGAKPSLTHSSTYVPISFFREFVNNAYVFEGQVVVDNFEKIQ